ncbi:MAG: Gfo/Idh/MocA family protein [Gemmatimonadales bacterium]
MRFGVVGAGVIGQLRARSIRENPATELAGVADPVLENARLAVTGSEGKPCTSIEELLALPRLDAIIVSSPVQYHEQAVLQAFGAGMHVLCEKPLSNTVESCRRMVEAGRKAGKRLATGFNHRYYPSMKFVKQAVDEGRIGELDHVRVFGGHDGLHNFRADWQYRSPESGGGAMMDVGIHMTDLARYVLGDISEVFGVATNRVWEVPGSEDNAMAIFKSPSGVSAVYQATWTEWKGYGFFVEAYGDRGMVRGFYAPMRNVLITQDRPGGPRRTTTKYYPEIMVREKLRSWTSTALLSFKDELADFLRMLEGQSVALADGVAGFRAVEIANAVYRSTTSGEPVTLSGI